MECISPQVVSTLLPQNDACSGCRFVERISTKDTAQTRHCFCLRFKVFLDVSEVVKVLCAVGFSIRHLDTSEPSDVTPTGVSGQEKRGGCRVVVSCTTSGLRAVLETVGEECRCSSKQLNAAADHQVLSVEKCFFFCKSTDKQPIQSSRNVQRYVSVSISKFSVNMLYFVKNMPRKFMFSPEMLNRDDRRPSVLTL
jgi:hypothetical protein